MTEFKPEYVQPFQEKLELDTLYLCSAKVLDLSSEKIVDVREQLTQNIWVDSGSVKIYASNKIERPDSLDDMTLEEEDTFVSALKGIDIVPRWLYVEQNIGTSTDITVTGIDVESKGDFS